MPTVHADQTRRHRLRTSLTALLAGALVVACGGDDGGTGPDEEGDLVGSFELRSVNGEGVPWVAGVTDQETLKIMGGTLTFTPQDTFELVIRWRVEGPDPRETEEVHRGQFVPIGEVIWFPSTGELSLAGKIEAEGQIRLLGRFFEQWTDFFTEEYAFMRFR